MFLVNHPALLFLVIVLILFPLFFCSSIISRKREEKLRQKLSKIAGQLNLIFTPGYDYNLGDQISFLADDKAPENCFATDVISGKYQNHDVMAFELHYETSSQDETHKHQCSVFTLKVPATFPGLTIQHVGLLIRTLAIGQPDLVKLESAEFSKHFLVWSKDKKFAYEVCTPAMMEFLLGHHDLDFRIKNQFIALVSYSSYSRFTAETIEFNLQRLAQIRSLMPDYLFTDNAVQKP